jgi:hypothetical protein
MELSYVSNSVLQHENCLIEEVDVDIGGMQ